MHADAYVKEHLFKPLDIKKYFWLRNREGHSHAGGGLALTSRDMAKLGLLYLNKGRWEGEQIVPESWIRESFTMHVAFENPNSDMIGYGYLWWILKPDPQGNGSQNIYAAMGFKAQYIFVIPEHNMVVVINGDTRSSEDQRQPRRFLYSHILQAVNRDR
jgi:CubicO group peptidase (beta-lactamase class C family)